MKKNLLVSSLLFVIFAAGCVSNMLIPIHPLLVSETPSVSPDGSISIGLVKLQRPLDLGEKYGDVFSAHLAQALDNGMLAACKLVSSNVQVFERMTQNHDVDILLIPTNPFFEIGKRALGIKATLSMDVRVINKGEAKERGFLAEVSGYPNKARPKRQVKINNIKYGLIGSKVDGGSAEKAINSALFSFSIEFAQKVSKLVSQY